MSEPRTKAGRRLLTNLGGDWDSPTGHAILAIEAEAAALASKSPRETALREAAQTFLDAEAEPAYSWVIESQTARAEGRPNREVERMDRIRTARTALRAALADNPASEPRP